MHEPRQQQRFFDQRRTADASCEGLRLDQALSQLFGVSRRRARRAIDDGGVYLGKSRCRSAGRRIRQGDRLRLVMLENERLRPLEREQILWRQAALVLLHKRTGQYAQEALHRSRGCIPDELSALLGSSEVYRPVHRLDRDTSGLMLLCSDARLLQHLQRHWHDAVCKRYLAVVEPAPEWQIQNIRLPIGRQRDALGRYRVDPEGRECHTEADVLERRGERALLSLTAHTGRTHQLRVHLSSLGCPILGDRRYGGRSHARLMLHAEQLCITPPALPEKLDWRCPTEEDWEW